MLYQDALKVNGSINEEETQDSKIQAESPTK